MHGVPADLDLSFLHGAELIQVCLGKHQVQFHFHAAGSIYVDGRWELLDVAGEQIDRRCDEPQRPPYQLHRLLGQSVAGSEVSAPDSFLLRFGIGDELRIYDSAPHYESFQIQPGNIFV